MSSLTLVTFACRRMNVSIHDGNPVITGWANSEAAATAILSHMPADIVTKQNGNQFSIIADHYPPQTFIAALTEAHAMKPEGLAHVNKDLVRAMAAIAARGAHQHGTAHHEAGPAHIAANATRTSIQIG